MLFSLSLEKKHSKAAKWERQADLPLSTSRFFIIDKSICRYRQVDSKELQDASEVDILSRSHV